MRVLERTQDLVLVAAQNMPRAKDQVQVQELSLAGNRIHVAELTQAADKGRARAFHHAKESRAGVALVAVPTVVPVRVIFPGAGLLHVLARGRVKAAVPELDLIPALELIHVAVQTQEEAETRAQAMARVVVMELEIVIIVVLKICRAALTSLIRHMWKCLGRQFRGPLFRH